MDSHIEKVQYRVRDAGEGRWHDGDPCPVVEDGAERCPLDVMEERVTDLLGQAYAEQGAPEDCRVFVRLGERMEFGVWVHGDDDRLHESRLYEIAAEAEAYIKRRIWDEHLAGRERWRAARARLAKDESSGEV